MEDTCKLAEYLILFHYILPDIYGSAVTRDRRAAGSLPALLHCVFEQEHYFSTGSTQEDPSLYNWKIFDGT